MSFDMKDHKCRNDWFNCCDCSGQVCDDCKHPEHTHLCYDCGEEEVTLRSEQKKEADHEN